MARQVSRSCGPWLLLLVLHTAVSVLPPSHALSEPGTSRDALSVQGTTLDSLRRTLDALKGALTFFQGQHHKVNLDAVIGTRIVQGTLKVLMANLDRRGLTERLPGDVVSDMHTVHLKAKDFSDAAVPFVRQSQPRYYHRIGPTLREGLWDLNYTQRTLPGPVTVPVWPYSMEEAMTETQSDDCLTELFGTTGRDSEKCDISDLCWRRMTVMGYHRYSLSHQIFYLQIAEQSGCLPQLLRQVASHGQGSLGLLQDVFCANMLHEAAAIARGHYPGPQQDLFMEQAAFCGMYGYVEFFRYPWLDHILSWQDTARGCYTWSGWPQHSIGNRRKREERRLDNGCLCHRTTVAAAALAQYVRFLAETYLAHGVPSSVPT